ncbi:DUF2958 domain-containing protein, partial [Stenotrophomonas sp. 3diitr2024]|uniref:DUF2958 domain-containing protein n=1 Tax=Stenotrophomonas sp. 3diitr2024 TaxID=3345115 RepID=UPI0035C97897
AMTQLLVTAEQRAQLLAVGAARAAGRSIDPMPRRYVRLFCLLVALTWLALIAALVNAGFTPDYWLLHRLEGVAAKETGEDRFDSPKALLDAVKAKRYGGLEDKRIGSVPVNFL